MMEERELSFVRRSNRRPGVHQSAERAAPPFFQFPALYSTCLFLLVGMGCFPHKYRALCDKVYQVVCASYCLYVSAVVMASCEQRNQPFPTPLYTGHLQRPPSSRIVLGKVSSMTRVTEMASRTTGLHGFWKILRHLVKDITSTTVEHLTANSRQVLTRG